MATKSIINELEARVRRLVGEHRDLSAAVATLTAERESLMSDNRSLAQRVKELENQLSLMQLRDGFGGGGADKTKAKARVNRLMREVDRCIAIVNKQ